MGVNVLFFASLRETLGKAQVRLDLTQPIPVRDVWRLTTGQDTLPANLLISVNQDYAAAETLVRAGDEVAFFPPVTGG